MKYLKILFSHKFISMHFIYISLLHFTFKLYYTRYKLCS